MHVRYVEYNVKFLTSSLQHLADSRLETIAENEELKSNISKLQEMKKELTSKISHLDKEKLNYENQCSDLELKVVINFLICSRYSRATPTKGHPSYQARFQMH